VSTQGFKGDFLANAVLNSALGGAPFPVLVTVHVALYTAAPTSAGGGTEVSGGGYTRLPIANNETNFPPTADKRKTNGTDFHFGTALADWGLLVWAALFDQNGNMLYAGPLSNPKSVFAGDPFLIPAGGAVFTEA
jgi:hypothetical protein